MRINRLIILSTLIIILGIVVIVLSIKIYQQPKRDQPMMMMGNNMKGMMRKMMSGILPSGITPNDLPDPGSVGAKLMDRYCTQCHALPSPEMHTAEEWPPIADRMFSRMSMMSGMEGMKMMDIKNPSHHEKQEIIAYLLSHAMKAIMPGSIPSPQSRGAIAFMNICSRCHALPDPKSYSAAQWPKIVAWMRSNMRVMGKGTMTDKEEKEILSYLTSNAK